MISFNLIAQTALYLTMGLVLALALAAVLVKNLFRAAIFLALMLIAAAIIYFFFHAEFIAAIQILIYVGAVMTLVIFAIMLTTRIGNTAVPQSNRQKWLAGIFMLPLVFVIIRTLLKTPWKLAAEPLETNAVAIGKALMTKYVFPFEMISLVLLVALVGAVVVARSDK